MRMLPGTFAVSTFRAKARPIVVYCWRASVVLLGLLIVAAIGHRALAAGVVFEGKQGPGNGKHIVLVSGDEEYRSEEGLPQLAKILAKRHGFKCTVLFAIDPDDGTINPNQSDNIPGLEALDSADLLVMLIRFRDLPADQMKHIVDYVESGKPVIGLRTATHAFAPEGGPYARWGWQSKEWDGGFGRQVLGETWINHHGHHGKQSTRGIIAHRRAGASDSARHRRRRHLGTDRRVRRAAAFARRLPAVGVWPGARRDAAGSEPRGRQAERSHDADGLDQDIHHALGKTARVFTTTMGASQDLIERGTAAVVGQCLLLVPGHGRPDSRRDRRGHRRGVQALAIRQQRLCQARQAGGSRA